MSAKMCNFALWQSAIYPIMSKIIVQNTPITVLSVEEQDYISLTDMASAKEGDSRSADIIKNWLRNRYTIEFLGTWEVIHNPNFKVVEFDHFRMSAGLPSFVLSASEWIERTNAIGIIVRKGRYGGTYAHKDIAFEFGSAISVPFKLYLIEEFQRLKLRSNVFSGGRQNASCRKSTTVSTLTQSSIILYRRKSLQPKQALFMPMKPMC